MWILASKLCYNFEKFVDKVKKYIGYFIIIWIFIKKLHIHEEMYTFEVNFKFVNFDKYIFGDFKIEYT